MSTATPTALGLSQEEIFDNLYSFIERLDILLKSCISFGVEKGKFTYDTDYIETFKEIQRSTFYLLIEENSKPALTEWMETLSPNDLEILSLLATEMQFFLQRYPTIEISPSNFEIYRNTEKEEERKEQLDEGLENGKTIKDSLEKFLGKTITGYFKKALNVLNELLSIARTFI